MTRTPNPVPILDALSELCATLDYHIARARLWKQTAKKWRSLALLASLSWKTIIKQRDDALADADRRLELLKQTRRFMRHEEYCSSRYGEKVCNCGLSKLRLDLDEELADAK